jgi:hypothetical protein
VSSTIITDNVANNSPIMVLNTGSTTTVHVTWTGIKMQGSSSLADGNAKYSGMMQVNGFSKNFRMHNNYFTQQTYGSSTSNGNAALVRYGDCVWGVTDHNSFFEHGTGNAIQVLEGSCYGDSGGQGDKSWSTAADFGTAEGMYVEDNTFSGDFWNSFINDCWQGGREIIRKNNSTTSATQGHATGSGDGSGRSCRMLEIYDNTFTGIFDSSSGNSSYTVTFIPGGTAMLFGNTATASGTAGWKLFASLVNDHFNGATNYDLCNSSTLGFMYNGTTAINSSFLPDVRRSDYAGVPSPWDGNTNTEGYPVLDQVGRGAGDLLFGSYIVGCSTTGNRCSFQDSSGTSPCNIHWPHQAVEPVYMVNNAWSVPSGSGGTFVGVTDATTNMIQENREYYKDVDGTGTVGTFTGNPSTGTGTGSGARSARPTTCTTGVAYWATTGSGTTWNNGATDSGCLDVCTATNTWTSCKYTPYTYPHPLVTGSTVTPVSNLLIAVK